MGTFSGDSHKVRKARISNLTIPPKRPAVDTEVSNLVAKSNNVFYRFLIKSGVLIVIIYWAHIATIPPQDQPSNKTIRYDTQTQPGFR